MGRLLQNDQKRDSGRVCFGSSILRIFLCIKFLVLFLLVLWTLYGVWLAADRFCQLVYLQFGNL